MCFIALPEMRLRVRSTTRRLGILASASASSKAVLPKMSLWVSTSSSREVRAESARRNVRLSGAASPSLPPACSAEAPRMGCVAWDSLIGTLLSSSERSCRRAASACSPRVRDSHAARPRRSRSIAASTEARRTARTCRLALPARQPPRRATRCSTSLRSIFPFSAMRSTRTSTTAGKQTRRNVSADATNCTRETQLTSSRPEGSESVACRWRLAHASLATGCGWPRKRVLMSACSSLGKRSKPPPARFALRVAFRRQSWRAVAGGNVESGQAPMARSGPAHARACAA
mmetsp:Transcript_24357/g.61808  ORF Transcript_24357/g.61808 Transcript_24357/m.61808 type:complete len:288 (+) Transcript_24357:320-1183(+)